MLGARVLMMVVMVWVSFASSHWISPGHKRPYGHNKPNRPFIPPPFNPCCKVKCNADEYCVVKDCGEAACFPLNRCNDIECPVGFACDTAMNTPNCLLPPLNRCNDIECPVGFACDTAMNTPNCLLPPLNRCNDIECPVGFACNTTMNTPNCLLPLCIDGEVTLNNDCSITECGNGEQVAYTGTEAPFVPVRELEEKGCLVLVDSMTKNWNDARADCRTTHEGDLYVVEDFPGLILYLEQKNPNVPVWLGVKDLKWVDGTTVAFYEWNLNEPSKDNKCGATWVNGKLLRDYSCNTNFYYLCQKGISYPIGG